jgi:hypothetical protein
VDDITFMDEMEAIAEEVADSMAYWADTLAEALAPDGRPFGKKKLTERQRLRNYVNTFKGNPQGQLTFVRDAVGRILNPLQGAPPEVVGSVHPYEIAFRHAIHYSSLMERLYAEEQVKIRESNASYDDR